MERDCSHAGTEDVMTFAWEVTHRRWSSRLDDFEYLSSISLHSLFLFCFLLVYTQIYSRSCFKYAHHSKASDGPRCGSFRLEISHKSCPSFTPWDFEPYLSFVSPSRRRAYIPAMGLRKFRRCWIRSTSKTLRVTYHTSRLNGGKLLWPHQDYSCPSGFNFADQSQIRRPCGFIVPSRNISIWRVPARKTLPLWSRVRKICQTIPFFR